LRSIRVTDHLGSTVRSNPRSRPDPRPSPFQAGRRWLGNNGALTIPANTTGHPAVAIPIGTVGGMPVSVQVIRRRHSEHLLLDLARVVETERPWPLVAPGAPV
jgi:Asp-tRNA(Asn)/Glu-tRNA(Gln) amidotransferase A subunit family amidase